MDHAALLAIELGRFARMHHTIKAQLSAHAPDGLEWAAMGILGDVIKRGPLRQTCLATCSLLDQSTVSRHVAALVKAGLVERRPDPGDGRAALLAATAAGLDAFTRFAGQRTATVARLVAGWEADDVERLTTYMRRLIDDFEQHRSEALAVMNDAVAATGAMNPRELRAVLGIPEASDAASPHGNPTTSAQAASPAAASPQET